MIEFKNTKVLNIEGALYGMRMPYKSFERFDTKDGKVGSNDLDLAQSLVKAGPEHRKFLRQIFVNVTITAPIYWWAQFDTYKIGVTRNSSSFMHRGGEFLF